MKMYGSGQIRIRACARYRPCGVYCFVRVCVCVSLSLCVCVSPSLSRSLSLSPSPLRPSQVYNSPPHPRMREATPKLSHHHSIPLPHSNVIQLDQGPPARERACLLLPEPNLFERFNFSYIPVSRHPCPLQNRKKF